MRKKIKFVVTGAAGFIGMSVAMRLLARGDHVLGIDNLNNYYSNKLKKDRIKCLEKFKNFKFIKLDICNKNALEKVIRSFRPSVVVHLAAQPGVNYSILFPEKYFKNNLLGFFNIIEISKNIEIDKLIFASSSSIYGEMQEKPISEINTSLKPLSFYAATKSANELMAYSYSNIYKLNIIGLRYFTVFGPWGRPDMAPWIFTSNIFANKKISLFNNGISVRNFTYIDDAVTATILAIDAKAILDENCPIDFFNVSSGSSILILDFLNKLEENIGIKSQIKFENSREGDINLINADISKARSVLNFEPSFDIDEAIKLWVKWYRAYNNK